MIEIVYPLGISCNPGTRQAFTNAVLHGICMRMNSDTNPRHRNQRHAFRAGYWFGRVSAFVQLRPAAIGNDVDFPKEVLNEVNRLQKEIEKEQH